MQILVLLDMYFDAPVVFVTSHSLLFRFSLANLAILCVGIYYSFFSHVFFELVDLKTSSTIFSEKYAQELLIGPFWDTRQK